MNVTFNPEAAADRTAEADDKAIVQFEAFDLDTAIPEVMRTLAGTAVTQTREAYERSKTALEAGLEALERSFDAAGQAVVALDRKIIEIAQHNVDSSFDLAKNLASAKNLAEIVELQGTYWRRQFGLLMEQAEQVRALSVNATTDVAEPIKQHATQQAEQVRALSEKMNADATVTVNRQATDLEMREAS